MATRILRRLGMFRLLRRLGMVVPPGTDWGQGNWTDCGMRFRDILVNNATWNGFTKELIENNYTWTGPIKFLPSEYRNDALYVPYDACVGVCGSRTIGFNDKQTALNILATWVFPLAILITLPWGQGGRNLLEALSHWLGSPQTALTATLWNFWQMRLCYLWASRQNRPQDGRNIPQAGFVGRLISWVAYVKRGTISLWRAAMRSTRGRSDSTRPLIDPPNTAPVSVYNNAMFVLSAFNQVDLGFEKPHDTRADPREEEGGNLNKLLSTLLYGIFRPLSLGGLSLREQKNVELTTALLEILSTQLRINRRRGVIPMLLSLVTFYMAFSFSVALAFGDMGDSTSIFVLDIGIFFSYVPVEVCLLLLDRSPNDSDAQMKIMSRWLYNIDAIRKRADDAEPVWWAGGDVPAPYKLERFTGQGRTLSYAGLPHAVLSEIPGTDTSLTDALRDLTGNRPSTLSRRILDRVQQRNPFKRPRSWNTIARLSQATVWLQVMLAFFSDFFTPTMGPGCWSLIFIGYGVLSSVTWELQFFFLPVTMGRDTTNSKAWRRAITFISHLSNALAILYIVFVLAMFSGGILNNCWCNSLFGGFLGWGGYVDFMDFKYYQSHYPASIIAWTVCTAISLTASVVSMAVAVYWWWRCRGLWEARPDTTVTLESIDFRWLH
ncbi:hypothetical protein QBC47DRAFT_443745 [Echria macrotheca]|uniref:Uncharacterized protein n=1 Tax=Echria macrotheca TaxID=438768 RepID=A0AAJ0BFN9_9PEZI|nr:hypothetical protein QBC47DRAFT_443745 [Echria macrotheca]